MSDAYTFSQVHHIQHKSYELRKKDVLIVCTRIIKNVVLAGIPTPPCKSWCLNIHFVPNNSDLID